MNTNERRYPEQEDEQERDRADRHERAIERADRMMDEIRDREAEQRDREREDQP